MTEEKIKVLNDINNLFPQDYYSNDEKSHIWTGIINTESILEIDKLDLEMISDFKEFIYRNISDLCKFNFLYQTI